MASVDVIIVVEKDQRSNLDQLAKSLEDKGLHIQNKIARFGTIVGTSDSSQLDALKSVKGVEDVRPQRNFQLPPMSEKVPQ